jgi:hypothetical protein
MTLVNLSQLFSSEMWIEIVEDIYDKQDPSWKKAVELKMEKTEIQEDNDDLSYLREFM